MSEKHSQDLSKIAKRGAKVSEAAKLCVNLPNSKQTCQNLPERFNFEYAICDLLKDIEKQLSNCSILAHVTFLFHFIKFSGGLSRSLSTSEIQVPTI